MKPKFTPLNAESGFIFTEMARAHVSFDTYKLIYYVNLTDFFDMIPRMNILIDRASNLCDKMNDEICRTTVKQLKNQCEDANTDGRVILQTRRKRRGEDGACEWCGEVFHVIFGLEDAKHARETKTIVKKNSIKPTKGP